MRGAFFAKQSVRVLANACVTALGLLRFRSGVTAPKRRHPRPNRPRQIEPFERPRPNPPVPNTSYTVGQTISNSLLERSPQSGLPVAIRCLLSMLLSNQGSFPPLPLPGICGSTSPSATLTTRPAPHGVPVGVCSPPPGLPVLPPFPSSMRAAATSPAQPTGALVARFPVGGSLPRSLSTLTSITRVFGVKLRIG